MAAVVAVHIVAVSMTVVDHSCHNFAAGLAGETVAVVVGSMAVAEQIVESKSFGMGYFAAHTKTAAAVIAVNPAIVGVDMVAAGKRSLWVGWKQTVDMIDIAAAADMAIVPNPCEEE